MTDEENQPVIDSGERKRLAAKKYYDANKEKVNARSREYMKTPAGRKSVAKAYLRYYLKSKILDLSDVKEVMGE